MVLPLAVIAVVLAADFLLVLRRGHDEWRDGESLSRTTGWLIASLYFGIVALFVYAILWQPGALDVPVVLASVVGSLLIVAGTLLALPGVASFRSVRQLYGVERGELITTGIYRYSRNPQYVGIGLVLVGAAETAPIGGIRRGVRPVSPAGAAILRLSFPSLILVAVSSAAGWG